MNLSSTISLPFEIEVQLQNAFVKNGLEAVLFADVPFFVYYFEGEVFVRSTSFEGDDDGLWLVWDILEVELGCEHLVEQVRIEDVELVALDHFRRWVVGIVVGLIVFVPFKASFD